MIVYKAVARKENTEKNRFAEYISNQVLHVRKNWKCNPKKYVVYKINGTEEYGITKVETVENWNENDKDIEVMGNLGELFNSIFNDGETTENEVPVYLSKSNQAVLVYIVGPPNTFRLLQILMMQYLCVWSTLLMLLQCQLQIIQKCE